MDSTFWWKLMMSTFAVTGCAVAYRFRWKLMDVNARLYRIKWSQDFQRKYVAVCSVVMGAALAIWLVLLWTIV